MINVKIGLVSDRRGCFYDLRDRGLDLSDDNVLFSVTSVNDCHECFNCLVPTEFIFSKTLLSKESCLTFVLKIGYFPSDRSVAY